MLCSLGMVALTPSPSVFYDSFIWVFSALHLSMSLSSLPAVCHACRTFLRSFTFSHCPVVHPVSHQPALTLMRLTGHGVALGVNCPSCFYEPSFGEARHMVLQCSFIGVRFSSICSLISSLVLCLPSCPSLWRHRQPGVHIRSSSRLWPKVHRICRRQLFQHMWCDESKFTMVF